MNRLSWFFEQTGTTIGAGATFSGQTSVQVEVSAQFRSGESMWMARQSGNSPLAAWAWQMLPSPPANTATATVAPQPASFIEFLRKRTITQFAADVSCGRIILAKPVEVPMKQLF